MGADARERQKYWQDIKVQAFLEVQTKATNKQIPKPIEIEEN